MFIIPYLKKQKLTPALFLSDYSCFSPFSFNLLVPIIPSPSHLSFPYPFSISLPFPLQSILPYLSLSLLHLTSFPPSLTPSLLLLRFNLQTNHRFLVTTVTFIKTRCVLLTQRSRLPRNKDEKPGNVTERESSRQKGGCMLGIPFSLLFLFILLLYVVLCLLSILLLRFTLVKKHCY